MNDQTAQASHDENKLIAERRAKLAKRIHNPYPNDFRRDALAQDLQSTYQERDAAWFDANPTEVRVAGRMMAKRDMGKTSFVGLRDGSGDIQLFLQAARLEADYEEFKSWDVGDIIAATGTLMRTKTGELSIRVAHIRSLVKSLRPLPDKWHGLSDTEARYRMRYVDLIVNPESRRVFECRTQVIRFIRQYLDAAGFMEVETPMMQPIPGGAVARPFVTHHNALDQTMYMRIAPELYLKRLVVGGLERVYEINRNFRNEGLSTRHNPEFTMLELYWAFVDYQEIMRLVERLITGAAEATLGKTQFQVQDHVIDVGKPFRRVTIEELIREHHPDLDVARLRDVEYLRQELKRRALPFDMKDGAGKLQMVFFDHTIESTLIQPTFAYGYPTEVSPLSRCNDQDPFITDRFELFIAGRELANGFSELNDSEDQARRFKAQVQLKDAGDHEAMYFDADYIRALEYGLPPTGGLGIGIDRLIMLYANVGSIRDVLLFPQMKPESSV